MKVIEFLPWHVTVIGARRVAVGPELATRAAGALLSGPARTITTDDDIILAAVGGAMVTRRTCEMWAIVAEAAKGHPLALARGVRWCLSEMIRRYSVGRFQCAIPEDDQVARRWAESFGLKAEPPPLKAFGDSGETFVRYAWLAEPPHELS